jgi:tetratricopeptide (TPR) repeat protein
MPRGTLPNKSIRIATLFFSVFLLPLFTVSQNLDSLKARVNAAPEKERFEMILSYMRSLLAKDPQLAFTISPYAIEYAEKKGDSLMITKSLFAKGHIYRVMDRYKDGLIYLHAAYGIAKRNNYKEEFDRILNSLALSYSVLGNFDTSLQYHFEALRFNSNGERIENLSITFNNIGLLYSKLGNFEKSLTYYLKSIEAKRSINSTFDLERAYINTALCYNKLKKFDLAEEYIKTGLNLCGNSCSETTKMEADFALGVSYFERGRYKEAFYSISNSLLIAKKIKYRQYELFNLLALSKIKREMKKYNEALILLSEAELIAQEFGFTASIIDIYEGSYKVYWKIKENNKSLKYLKLYSDLRDSIFGDQLIKSVAILETEYTERENNAKIAHQQEVLKLQEETVRRQQWVIALVGVSVLLVAVVAWLLYRSNRMRKKVNALLESKVQERTYQLQESHSAILSQVEERKEEVAQAYNKLTALKATLKGVINIGKKETDPRSVNECLEEVDKAVDRMEEIAKQHLTNRR